MKYGCVDGTRDQALPITGDAETDQLGADRFGYRNNCVIGAAFISEPEPWLCRLHPPRQYRRNAGRLRRASAEAVGAAPRMYMNQVGPLFAQEFSESMTQRKIEVAAETPFEYPGINLFSERMPCPANEQVFDAVVSKTIDQIAGLSRTTVEMPTGFKMKDLHMMIITELGRLPDASETE